MPCVTYVRTAATSVLVEQLSLDPFERSLEGFSQLPVEHRRDSNPAGSGLSELHLPESCPQHVDTFAGHDIRIHSCTVDDATDISALRLFGILTKDER